MARRCGWLRDLRELLVERQSDLGKNQEEMAVTHTEKQLKNTHAFDLTDTISAAKSYGLLRSTRPQQNGNSQSFPVSSPLIMVRFGLLRQRLTPKSQSLLVYSPSTMVVLGPLRVRQNLNSQSLGTSSTLKLVKLGLPRKQSTLWSRSWTCSASSFTSTLLRPAVQPLPAVAV